jgi:hypothetical protein
MSKHPSVAHSLTLSLQTSTQPSHPHQQRNLQATHACPRTRPTSYAGPGARSSTSSTRARRRHASVILAWSLLPLRDVLAWTNLGGWWLGGWVGLASWVGSGRGLEKQGWWRHLGSWGGARFTGLHYYPQNAFIAHL